MRPTGGAAASPAVTGGRVFVASDGAVRALNAGDGSDAWPAPVLLPGPLSPPAVAGNAVFVTSYTHGTATALRVDDGSSLWSTTVPGTYDSCPDPRPSPAAARVCTRHGARQVRRPSLFAFDAAAGTTRWSVGDASYTTSPAVTSGLVYVASAASKTIEARHTSDGGLKWAGAVGDHTYSSPAVAGDTVFIGADDGSVRAFDATGHAQCAGSPGTCQPLWSDATGGAVRSSPGVADNVVYVGSNDGSLHAYGIPPSLSRRVGYRSRVCHSRRSAIRTRSPSVRRQYTGLVKVFTVARNGRDSYQVTDTRRSSSSRTSRTTTTTAR